METVALQLSDLKGSFSFTAFSYSWKTARVIAPGGHNYCWTTNPYFDILKVQLEIYKADQLEREE